MCEEKTSEAVGDATRDTNETSGDEAHETHDSDTRETISADTREKGPNRPKFPLSSVMRAAIGFTHNHGAGDVIIVYRNGRWMAFDGLLGLSPDLAELVGHFDNYSYDTMESALNSVVNAASIPRRSEVGE